MGRNAKKMTVEDTTGEEFDGDGQAVKRFERETFNTGALPQNKTSYNLNSSVLGGAVLATINEQGIRGETNVYGADGAKIAKIGSNLTTWTHEAPITGSKFDSFSNSPTAGGVSEFESLGGALPAAPPPAGSPDWLYSGNYQQSGNPFDLNGGCQLNGFPEDCAWVMRTSSPTRYDRKGRKLPEPFEWSAEHHIPISAIGNWSPYHPVAIPWSGGTQTVRLETEHFGGEHPQTITFFRRIITWQTQKQPQIDSKLPQDLKEKVLDIANRPNCKDVIQELLERLKKRGKEYETNDVEFLFERINTFEINPKQADPSRVGWGASEGIINGKRYIWYAKDLPESKRRSWDYAMNTIAELLHHARKGNKTYSDADLDNAVRDIMTPEEWQNEVAEREKVDGSAGTIAHKFVNKFCRFTQEDIQ
jgi:hypothetical protein